MISERFRMNRRTFRDDRTGREVWQVTDGEFECVAPYMDKCAWTPDDRFLVFMCNRSGAWQPYRLELETGEASLLYPTREALFRSVVMATGHGVAVSAAQREAYCQDGPRLVAVNVDTFQARQAVDFSEFISGPPGKGHAAALSRDGSLVVLSFQTPRGEGRIAVARTDGSNAFEVVCIPRDGLCAGHELICPGDDRVISFHGYPDVQNDAKASPDRRVAQWRIERVSGRLMPLVLVPPGFRSTHSLWGPSGDRFYFHRKTVPGWTPTALCSVNRDGGDLRVYHETTEHRLGHSAPSPDEAWIVTDSQDPDTNILMLVSTRRDKQHMLCWPNTSIGSGRPDRRSPRLPAHTDRHTHPAFSLTGRYVHYTSDVSGRSQVYVVPVADLTGA